MLHNFVKRIIEHLNSVSNAISVESIDHVYGTSDISVLDSIDMIFPWKPSPQLFLDSR